ncbi:acyl carrier protein [Kitasatospora sp. MMS16-BH015]|uniref:phosphopantetheine-binding protein n=1 Tax=Kitasatospora sp. MMS16-BH015 TaxID=2018025 RepID=UPI000CA3B11B|nr:phosphopantetheine-binding protein [Kitasatospora sp. MMS16-BH015]AUG80689.1 acyl carrier protein [Kitasatospora sp. MMS16-BH015]
MSNQLDQVKAWLLKRHPEREDIAPDLDLIENRLIDSLSFVEFVFMLEQVSGTPIDMDALEVDDLRSLSSIEARYLAAVAS